MEREREQGSDRLDTEERKELNDSDFGLPEERKYPMPDATYGRLNPIFDTLPISKSQNWLVTS